MTLVADVSLEILAPKKTFEQMSKKPCLRGPLDKQQGKWVNTPLQSE